MLTDRLLQIDRLTQETFKYCAPACIQMLLKYVGVQKTQDEIWNDTRSLLTDSTRWFTDPAAVAAYLQRFHSVSEKAQIKTVVNPTISRYLARVARVADMKEFPALMLVYGGKHWVLCVGLKAEYVDSDREHVKLAGIYVADPSRGSDGIQFFPINEWFSKEFVNPVSIAGAWQGDLLSITDGGDDEVDELEILPPARPSGGGVGELGVDEVFSIAGEDIQHYGLSSAVQPVQLGYLLDKNVRAKSLRTAHFFGFNDAVMPIPIKKLDDNTMYYLAPLMIDGQPSWAAVSSRYTGLMAVRLSHTICLPPSGNELMAAAKLNFSRLVTLNELPGFVWPPSIEFPSLFDLAKQVAVDGVNHFVDCEGRFFRNLTTNIRG